jgi:uncharacterized protein YukE
MEPSDVHTEPDSPSLGNSNSSDLPLSTPSSSPIGTHPSTPSLTSVPLTIEDRLAQLQCTLVQINTERESLSTSLKSARRDSQKADAALRSEIDALKRASERHSAADHRAKQKILSLQEAIKRAQTVTRETEELITEIRVVLPGMNEKCNEKEEAYNKFKSEADRARTERELETEKEKKRLDSMKNELIVLGNKLEKLNGKKEKLENGVIPEFEEQLKDIEREVENAGDFYVNTYAPATDGQEPKEDEHATAALDPKLDHSHSHSLPYLPTQRMRHQTISISRPSPVPIQRPPPGDAPFGQLWTHPASPHPPQAQTHNQRSSSVHHQTPILLTNPRRRKSSVSTPPYSQLQTSNSSPPTSLATIASAAISTLSSKAPAFEPGRPLKTVGVGAAMTTGFGSSPMAIQRPSAAGTVRMPVIGVRDPQAQANPAFQRAGVHGHFDGSRT